MEQSRINLALAAAIEGLQQRIAADNANVAILQQELRRTGGTGSPRPAGQQQAAPPSIAGKPGKKRVMTPDAKKRVAEAQKKRWAEYHKLHDTPKEVPAPAATEMPKRTISAKARKNMAAAQRKRHAAAKAAATPE
jgi:hypothetical protein